jgi:hypothetical protein
MKKLIPFILLAFCLPCISFFKTAKVVQIDVSAILNARPVTVLNHNKLVTWTKGIDGGGTGDGYLTMAAAKFNGDTAPHALPDKPVFAANAFHPEIMLHYSNNNTASAQTRNVPGEDSFLVTVPPHAYSGLYLCLTSSEGPSQLQFELVYTDGSTSQNFTLPDYYNDLSPNDTTIGYVAHDLAKWDSKNKMRETNHHNIDAVNIHPDARRVLTAVKITKSKPGYLVFWGATGVIAE